jgi:hypothetical protein
VTVVKAGLGVALENGRNLFVVNLSASTNLWTCVDGCGKMTFKGRPCVHILKALQSKGLPFFDHRYFHKHWLVSPAVTSKHIQRWCRERETFSDCMSSDDEAHEVHDDDSQDPDDDSANNVQDPKGFSTSTGPQHVIATVRY